MECTAKGSAERKTLIEDIVAAGYVPSVSTFYDVLSKAERGETIHDGRWKKRGWQARYSQAKAKTYQLVLPSAPEKKKRVDEFRKWGTWTGSIELKFAPITHQDLKEDAIHGKILPEYKEVDGGYGREGEPISSWRKKMWTICAKKIWVSGLDGDLKRRAVPGRNRILLPYLSLDDFPPPKMGGISLCSKLRTFVNYIKIESA